MRFSYENLRHLLLDKHMIRYQLRTKCGINSNSIAKLVKGQNITTDILIKIYKKLNFENKDIMKIVKKIKYEYTIVLTDGSPSIQSLLNVRPR